jgi:protein-S-isoprenylcysteine O-methyltransferase Ste14
MTLGVGLAILYTVALAPLFFIRTESLGRALPYYDRAERWSALGSAVVVTVHMTLACVTVSVTPAVPAWSAGLSLAVLASGIALWVWARAQIGPLHVRRLPDEAPLRLRRDGAFGLVRNPLYLGVLLMAAAPLCVAPRMFLVATYMLSAGTLAVRALQEERRLHAQLGAEYAAYCRHVKRLVPFVW